MRVTNKFIKYNWLKNIISTMGGLRLDTMARKKNSHLITTSSREGTLLVLVKAGEVRPGDRHGSIGK